MICIDDRDESYSDIDAYYAIRWTAYLAGKLDPDERNLIMTAQMDADTFSRFVKVYNKKVNNISVSVVLSKFHGWCYSFANEDDYIKMIVLSSGLGRR